MKGLEAICGLKAAPPPVVSGQSATYRQTGLFTVRLGQALGFAPPVCGKSPTYRKVSSFDRRGLRPRLSHKKKSLPVSRRLTTHRKGRAQASPHVFAFCLLPAAFCLPPSLSYRRFATSWFIERR